MSCRVDTSPLIAGSCVVSLYEGLGISGSALRTATASGASGAGLLYNDWDTGDDSKEFRALLVTAPTSGALTINEDGSFSLTGAADGSYTLVYRLFVDGADLGTATASITIGTGGGGTFSVSPAGISSALSIGVPTAAFSSPTSFTVSSSGIASTLSIGTLAAAFQYGNSMEPVTLQEAKRAARYSEDDLDPEIIGVITAAREQAEHLTSRVYKRRTFRFELDAWPAADYRFPVYDPDACEVSYYDESRTWAAMDPAAFEFAGIGAGAEIAPALDTEWPALGRRAVGARVRVTFTAGPASPDDVAECVKLYIKAVVSGWVNNPEAVQSKALTFSPLFEHLLDEQKVYG